MARCTRKMLHFRYRRIHFLYENLNPPGNYNPPQDKSFPWILKIKKPPFTFQTKPHQPPSHQIGGVEAIIASFHIMYKYYMSSFFRNPVYFLVKIFRGHI